MARTKKATAKKVEAKKVEEVVVVEAAEVKAEEVVETAAEEVKEVPVKKATKKAAIKKEETVEAVEEEKKAPVKKTTKKVVNANVMVEFNGKSVSTDVIVENIKKAFEAEGNQLSAIKDFQVYVKPEDNAAYYVINQDITGKVNLF